MEKYSFKAQVVASEKCSFEKLVVIKAHHCY
jgi:hypothetical protein